MSPVHELATSHPAAWTAERDDLSRLEQAYVAMRALAERFMRRERRDHTLAPTALVHEAWLRLGPEPDAEPRDRAQLLASAARAMRRVLIEHARRRAADKRSAARRVPFDGLAPEALAAAPREEMLARLDDALSRLAQVDPEIARLVELRFFGGFSVPQTAAIVGASPRTVKRDWRIAKGWLHRELARAGDGG